MIFLLFCFHKTPLFIAAEKGNREIIELLLEQQEIDINIKSILNCCLFNKIDN